MQPGKELRVAIGGLGAIGMALARRIDAGDVPGLRLAAVSARDTVGAETRVAKLATPVPVVGLSELAALAEVVVECAPAKVFAEVAGAAVDAGRIFMPLSVGQLLAHPDLVERARRSGARIVAPTGALIGLDAVRAAAEGEITSVTMVTRKPPGGLAGAPWLVENDIDVEGLTEAKLVFEGSAAEGVRGFPANVNVAAALSLAGIGPERTRLQIWADPGVTRNTHRIVVEADSARFEMLIENVPSAQNPRTGRITALSALATLRRLAAPLTVGT